MIVNVNRRKKSRLMFCMRIMQKCVKWTKYYLIGNDFICDSHCQELDERHKTNRTKWYLNKNMWCGAIWFRDIFNIKFRKNIKKQREREKKNETNNQCNRAICTFGSFKSTTKQEKKKSEIEITFLNSHFVNLKRGEQASTNSNRALNEEERNRVRTASEWKRVARHSRALSFYCQIYMCSIGYMAPQHIHGWHIANE